MIFAIIGFGALGFVIGMFYGYALGYDKGLKKLPDDLAAVVKDKADKIANDMIRELKDKM